MKKSTKKDRYESIAQEYIYLNSADKQDDAAAKLTELKYIITVLDISAEIYNSVFRIVNKNRGAEQFKTLSDILNKYEKFDIRKIDHWYEDINEDFTSLSAEEKKIAIACITYIKDFCSLKYIPLIP